MIKKTEKIKFPTLRIKPETLKPTTRLTRKECPRSSLHNEVRKTIRIIQNYYIEAKQND